MAGVFGGLALCLALGLATLGHALDLDEVHNLCQPREFHSFRRKVCSISKRSVDADDYAAFLRESTARTRRSAGAAAPLYHTPGTPEGAGSGDRLQRAPCHGGGCGGALEVPLDAYDNEWLQKLLLRLQSTSTSEQDPNQDRNTPQQDSENSKLDQLLPASPLLRTLGLSLSQGREDGRISADTSSFRNRNSYTNLLPENRWNDADEQKDAAMRSSLHDILAFRLLANEPASSGNRSSGLSYSRSRTNDAATRYGYEVAVQDGETLPELDNALVGGPPIADGSHAAFEPSDVFAFSAVDEGPLRSYGHWDRDDEFVLMAQKPRRNGGGAGPTVGMLREHCCLYGCTLNRHFHHFLSTCSSGA